MMLKATFTISTEQEKKVNLISEKLGISNSHDIFQFFHCRLLDIFIQDLHDASMHKIGVTKRFTLINEDIFYSLMNSCVK